MLRYCLPVLLVSILRLDILFLLVLHCYPLGFMFVRYHLTSRPQRVWPFGLLGLKLFVQIVVFNFCHIREIRQGFYQLFCPCFFNVLKY